MDKSISTSQAMVPIFSVPRGNESSTLVVTFQLNGLETLPGQSVILLGDCPELGTWELDYGYGMEYVNQNTWICEVAFNASVGQQIQFKFVLIVIRLILLMNLYFLGAFCWDRLDEKVDALWSSR